MPIMFRYPTNWTWNSPCRTQMFRIKVIRPSFETSMSPWASQPMVDRTTVM